MNTLMMVLQQPLSVAALARCLGLGPGKARAAGRRPGRRPARRPLQAAAALTEAAAPPSVPASETDSPAEGCGWFDSSHELTQGLVVLEHARADGLGPEVPVTVWLELVLGVTPKVMPAAPLAPAQGMIAV